MNVHQSPHVAALLEDLRNRTLDLKAFCTRVRQLLGADVLMKTVKGLQDAQKRKREGADGAGGGPSSVVASAPGAPGEYDACS